jgi:hypothetical protein
MVVKLNKLHELNCNFGGGGGFLISLPFKKGPKIEIFLGKHFFFYVSPCSSILQPEILLPV